MGYYYHYLIGSFNFYIGEENNFLTYISINFSKKRTTFDLPLKLKGTEFQQQVWTLMSQIPYGTTLSYQELSKKVGHPKASRAIGNVCHQNKILIIIPCHRIVAKNSLGGFGCGLSMKIKLLKLEKALK